MPTVTDPSSLRDFLIPIATRHIEGIITEVFHHDHTHKALVVYDTGCLLSDVLSKSYQNVLGEAMFIDFNTHTPEEIHAIFAKLNPSDFVVLIQSTNFRLDAFRIRVELFKRSIKVIEHPHLSRIADADASHYIDALEYDAAYYRHVGPALRDKLASVTSGVIDTGGELLYYDSPFENAKLNIGDYSQMNNIGGQFPIGEVFTEAIDLRSVHGRLNIFLFSDTTYKISRPPRPITLIIEEGQVVACENSVPAFDEVLSMIRRDEGSVWVRELGFGLNRAFDKTRTVGDTGSYERMCGVHVSLGAKHGIYAKEGFRRRDGLYHIDVFADTHTVTLGGEVVYRDGRWVV